MIKHDPRIRAAWVDGKVQLVMGNTIGVLTSKQLRLLIEMLASLLASKDEHEK